MSILENLKPEEVEALKKAYLSRPTREQAIQSLNASINTIKQGYREVWCTGFDKLDEKLGGGFFGGQLIFLGAISSLGKTSFALQIADQIASSGQDVLLFSLEMSSEELLAKSISRQTYLLTNTGDTLDKVKAKDRLKTRDILQGRVGSLMDDSTLFMQAEKETAKLNNHLHYIIGENDIDVDTVRLLTELHISSNPGSRPIIILDYLQILRPTKDALERRLDKRLGTDDDVTRLKVLARDLKLPVLVISAFNRASYLDPVSMASFKESSGIEYSSDVLMGMQFKGMDFKKHFYTKPNGTKVKGYESSQDHDNRVRDLYNSMQERANNGGNQDIELKILKNRTGEKGSLFFSFYPTYNYYCESDLIKDKEVLDWDDEINEPDFDEAQPISYEVGEAKGIKK